ncbi:MAG: hypothetical protein M3081_01025 [Gemmatimonadota bacterium]|nr:hypothetical protein [Gemmatimonadota bacterium]
MTESSEQPHWRFESEQPEAEAPRTVGPKEMELGTSWLRLLVQHTAFRATEQTEYQRLLSQLRAIERLFIRYTDLEAYYRESFLLDDTTPMSAMTDESVARAGHVASLQAELMEDVFYVLQLDRYANAPDNRGWMNLLRRWGHSPFFNERLDLLRTTYAEEFLQFYDLYIRGYDQTIDDSPIPHPWDAVGRRQVVRHTTRPQRAMAPKEGITALEEEITLLPGVFLDSGIREAAKASSTRRSGERPVEQPGTGQHGTGSAEPLTSSSEGSGEAPPTAPNA